MRPMTIRHTTTVLLAGVATTALLTACGGGGGGAPAARSDDAKALAFARCMRAAGIDFPDPGASNKPQLVRIPKGIAPKRLEAAQKNCAKKTGAGPKAPSKAEQAHLLDQALQFARCMRAHGINLPDPQAGGGGIVQKKDSGSGDSGIDPSSPAFARAQKACGTFMPAGAQLSVGKGGGGPSNALSAAPGR
jgi:hypothetical protein